MDYHKDWDRTVGDEAKRQYKVCGKKVVVTCPLCAGKITQFVEDTVYNCGIHNSVPNKKSHHCLNKIF